MTRDVNHSLPDEVLLAYSTGKLPVVFDLVVASHVSLCDDSRVRLEAFDAVGGAVLEEAAPMPMSAGSFDATLARICGTPAKSMAPEATASSVFPAPLIDYLGGTEEAVRWRSMGMGVRQAILHEEQGMSARLLSIPAGAQMPDHGHGGMEMTLVLTGAFRDEFGEYHRGDIEVANEDVQHTPTVIGEQDCICLAATDSRLKFNGLLPRLAQPFFRI